MDNDFLPHLFHKKGVLLLAFIIVALFIVTTLLQYTIVNNTKYFAAVISSVLADLTNVDRAENNIHPLTLSPTLIAAAQLKADDMAKEGYFSHISPEGVTPWHWFNKANYQFVYAGENLAINFSDSVDVERAWMSSDGHRSNILSEKFTEIGIATARGTYKGRETTFVVQLFGRPAKALASALPPAPPDENVSKSPVTSSSGVTILEATSENVETLAQDENFVAVQNLDAALLLESNEEADSLISNVPVYSTIAEKLSVAPRTTLTYAYMLLGLFISLILILMVAIEVRRQHPAHIAYALSLLVLIAGLYGGQALLFPQVLIH